MIFNEFRRMHSELIEHYQYIEHNLEGLYASICKAPFLIGLREVDKDNISALIRKIDAIQAERQLVILSEEEINRLNAVRDRRNFWCHNCYVTLHLDLAPKGLVDQETAQMLMNDYYEAEEVRQLLFDRKLLGLSLG